MANPDNGRLYTTVTVKEKQRIMELVEQNTYMNIRDFVRQAVREKLAKENQR